MAARLETGLQLFGQGTATLLADCIHGRLECGRAPQEHAVWRGLEGPQQGGRADFRREVQHHRHGRGALLFPCRGESGRRGIRRGRHAQQHEAGPGVGQGGGLVGLLGSSGEHTILPERLPRHCRGQPTCGDESPAGRPAGGRDVRAAFH